MKYIASALVLLALTMPASAQIVPPPATGNLNVNSLTSATNITANKYIGALDTGTNVALPGSNGAFLNGMNFTESLTLQDMGATAGNRRGQVEFHAGYLGLGFMNDQTGGRTFGLTMNGGAADGITGITSNSGSGAWAHTGDFSATGTQTILQSGGNGVAITPTASGGAPSISAVGTNGNVTLNIAAKGAAGINLNSSTAITGNATVTGNAYVAGQLGSANNISAPSPTNSGITIGGAPTWAMSSFYDQAMTANNRTMDMLFISGGLKFRFANDARNAFLDFLTINGGQATGVTGITSTSGSGAWVHTGDFTASGNMTAGGVFKASGGNQLQTFLTAAIPNCSAGNTGLLIAVTDVGGTPAWNGTLPAGTGTPAAGTTFPVFCDGTNWRIH